MVDRWLVEVDLDDTWDFYSRANFGEVIPDVVQAFARARSVTNDDDLVMVAGSLYVIGELRARAAETNED